MKRFIITEEERRSIRKMYLNEEDFDPSVDHESNIRIKSLEIDKNGVPTVVIEFWKDRVGHRSNYIDSIVKQVNNDGLTLKVDSRCQKYDDYNQKIPVKYERKGNTFTNSDILTLPEGCRVDIDWDGTYPENNKKVAPSAFQSKHYYCGSGNCMVKGVTARRAEKNPSVQTPPENQTLSQTNTSGTESL